MNARVNLAEQFNDAAQQSEAAKLGMWAFLATEILFFGVLFAAYVYCRVRFPDAFAEGSRHTDMLLGTLETAVLLISSGAVALAVRDVQLGGRRVAVWLLLLTAAFAFAFLAMHAKEYIDEWHGGLVPALHYTQHGPLASPMRLFYWLYFVITGFHGLHVTIGAGLMLTMAWKTGHCRYSPDYYTPLEVSALYWHLVDIVWIFVYPLIYLVGRSG